MQLKRLKSGSSVIVYDAESISQPVAVLFDARFWRDSGKVTGEAKGRGNALFVDTPFGPAVLREYLRGGAAARISRNRYLFLGYESSRPLAECHFLARLHNLGLPVPTVLGGICSRHGLSYSGALLTRVIPNATPLADLLLGTMGNEKVWWQIGKCIKTFHDAGVYHADLNARNILLDQHLKVWLIDFDRARFLPAESRKFETNLARLLRSLQKVWPEETNNVAECWDSLLAGYNS